MCFTLLKYRSLYYLLRRSMGEGMQNPRNQELSLNEIIENQLMASFFFFKIKLQTQKFDDLAHYKIANYA